ncbi:50S ribosomal protein L18, partial [Akkermansiaceae bacterium]|nr:50S ribosomal protein L18 [Akkermansiaceae bacterium]
MSTLNRKKIRQKVHRRIRKKLSGTATKPRLAVHFSNKNVYAQVIDDLAGKTLCAASTLDKEVEANGASKATAESVGKL